MKRFKVALATLGLVAAVAGPASALQIRESYLGTASDSTKWTMGPDFSATFNFNLTQLGGSGFLKNAANVTQSTVTPSEDATSYDPNIQQISSALLSFNFSDNDAINDYVEYNIKIATSDYVIGDSTFKIGGPNQIKSAFVEFDLQPFVNQLQDGTLISLVVTPTQAFANSIFLDKATYTVEVVPEPGTMLLFGIGLLSIPLIRRKVKK